MAKLRFRDIVNKVPMLDKARIDFLGMFLGRGIASLDRNYDIVKLMPDSVKPYYDCQKPAIFAVYHGYMVGMLRIGTRRNRTRILVSQSRDGECIARAVEYCGFVTARGSPKRGAVQGAKQLIRAARSGEHLIVTVDGPRGPIYEVKEGIIRIAEMTQLPIIPSTCAGAQVTRMWGWDKFYHPHWGTDMVYAYDEPIVVPRGINDEQMNQYRLQLEQSLSKLHQMTECYFERMA